MKRTNDRGKYQQDYYASTKDDRTAQRKVKLAVERNELIEEPCVDCGSTEKITSFHEDPANEPFVFDWVCKKCNKKRLNAIEKEIAEWDKAYEERQKHSDFSVDRWAKNR